MARGKYRGGKATGRRTFTSREELEAQGDVANAPNRDMPPSDSEEEEEEEAEDRNKCKGAGRVIETANPNAGGQKFLKAKNVNIDDDGEGAPEPQQLSRREREEIEKQQAQEKYWKLHEAGKTDQAKKDLERLALIRKQREEDAKKRQEEMDKKIVKK
mmetsp:Transcript_40060/g.55662  ORF Transcript_40060/g.55662 Transcript_40060/m.55662 type:complete len:158 (+) Transcript_40060:104-577(+)|eukprot:CAMPEP_0196576038 /NCGR_PEP_ID=MMETSP1081-20130531/5401_1 /TAXON_ID=36882 /ORGANISM="Pyramimonas amylifera, Strain CCMP720" /LENGTH=157 /DNA_ID=CAMNT_0041894533 /DNA_START=104 /DNA_END=577 /DNA_ORIENTATION=+